MNAQVLSHTSTSFSWWRVHYRNGSLGASAVHFATLLGDLAVRLDRTLAKRKVPNNWTVEDALDTFGKVLENEGISFAFDLEEPVGSEVKALLDLDIVERGLLLCDLQVIPKLRKHNRDLARLVMTAIGALPAASITDIWWIEEHILEEISQAEADLEHEIAQASGKTEFPDEQARVDATKAALEAFKQNQALCRWAERLASGGNSRVGYIRARWLGNIRNELATLKVESEADRLWVEWVAAVLDLLPEQVRVLRGKKMRAILDNSVFSDEGLSYDQTMGFFVCHPDLIGYYEQWVDDEYNNCGVSDTLSCDAKAPGNVALLVEVKEHLHSVRRLLARFNEIREAWEKEDARKN